ncbi:MAG TPA: hypothetical protein VK469_09205, partial [Candidatus Kapabacteria bacterium]|nr:hypothetical protein [Candidatus Kapabacteria bacterium]
YDDTSIFTAVIQVGLLERIYVDEYDFWGNKKSGRAYKFFHDQYTQFWLSAVFNKDILGRIDRLDIKSQPNLLDTLVDKIEFILDASQDASVLSGALYHWLYNNVFDKKKNPNEYFSILFNRLVAKESNNIPYFVGSFLHWLIEANILSAGKLNNELVRNGDIRLRKCFYQHIPYIWPKIAPLTLQTILAEEKEEDLIKSLGDIFVNLFTLEPAEEVMAFLDEVLLSYQSFKDVAKKVFEINRLKSDFLFMFIFIIQSFLCNFTDPKRLTIIRDFLKKKYNWVFTLLTNKKANGIQRTIRDVMFRTIETAGIFQWQQAVSSQARNDKFFEEDKGIIQRDVLHDFYKYCAAFHNGNMGMFSLDRDSEYMTMTFKMIEYRNRSLIGYVATLILVGVLRDHIEKLDEIIDEIIKLKSKPALSYSISVVHMLAKLDPNTVDHTLDIIHKKFLPEMIDNLGKDEDEYNISSFFVIGVADIERHWQKCEIIFADTIVYLTEKGDKKKIDAYGAMLVESVFPPDIRIGIRLCDYLLKKKLHKDLLWRDFTFTLLAGMLARSPKTLEKILDDNMIPHTIINDIRPFLTEAIIKFGSKVSYQHGWNNLLVLGFLKNKQVSYLLINFLLAELVQTSNLDEVAKIGPGLVVEAVQRFIMDDADNKSDDENLTVDETL